MNWVSLVVEHCMKVVAWDKYGFEADIVVVLRIAHKQKRLFIIPIDTIKSAFRVFSYLLKDGSWLLFDRIKLIIIFVSACRVRQDFLKILALAFAVHADNVLYIPGVVLLLFRTQKWFNCKGNSVFSFIQINRYARQLPFSYVSIYGWAMSHNQVR